MLTIVHASAAAAEDRAPFEHALVLAERAGARLVSLHASADPSTAARMLTAADVLQGWGRSAAVAHERRVHDCCADPVDTVLDGLRRIAPDLIVTGTHRRRGAIRVLVESRSEAIAENVPVPTLIVPLEGRGFVRSGALRLERALVPIGDADAARVAVERTAWLLELAGAKDVTVELLYVGARGAEPRVHLPEMAGVHWTHRTDDGPVDETIVKHAEDADLVVMATRGHDSLRDALLGTHTEHVLREAARPVLSVPMAR